MSARIRQSEAAPQRGPGWIWWSVGLAGLALALGMAQAWTNMERMDLAFALGRQQAALEQKQDLMDKLEVERGILLASHRLRARAETMGLEQAGTGRIRIMEPRPAALPPADPARGNGS